MFRVISGLSSPSKKQHVYEEIKQTADSGENVWLLVPEQFSLFTEKELLQTFGLSAQTRIKVITFSRLCNLVLSRMGPLRMKYIDGAGKQIIAAQVMIEMNGRLRTLGRNMRQKGFAGVLADTISEFKRYGVTPQALRFAAENADDAELSAKLEDLSELYAEYNRLIELQSADAEDNLSLICGRLRECDFLNGRLYIMHFRSFTPIEKTAIGELMHRMDVVLVADLSRDAAFGGLFYPVEHTIKEIADTAISNGTEISEEEAYKSEKTGGAAEYLKMNYFDRGAESFTGEVEEICICSLQNRYREVEYAADLIIKLCRTENRCFSDFLILTRDFDSYAKLIPAVFARRGIRVFTDGGRPISAKPLMRVITGTLDILAQGASYERVMKIASADLLISDRDAVDIFENYVLAAAPTPAMWQSKQWTYCPGGSDYDLPKINAVKNALLSGAEFIKSKISGRKTGGAIAEAVLEWLENGELEKNVNVAIATLAKQGKAETAEEYRQVWNSVISVLSQMTEIMHNTNMTYPQFAEVFEAACGGMEFGMTPRTLDCVVCSCIDKFRTDGSSVVIALGMNEGVFPMGCNTEGLISDAERLRMTDLGVEIAPGAESRRREEQLLIYAVLSAPRERLYLFYGLENNEGKPLQESEIIMRIRELFPQVAIYNPDEEADGLAAAEGASALFEKLAAALALYGGKQELLPQPARELYALFKSESHAKRLDMLKAVIKGENAECISAEAAEKLYGKPMMLSASQLENYNSCAFKYFMKYGLCLHEREKAGIEPTGTGTVQHDALYDFFSELKNSGIDPAEVEKEDCFRRVSEAVDSEAKKNSEILYESSAYYKYIVMRMKGIAARTAWEVIKFYKTSEFRPYGFEIKIGTNSDIPIVKVKDDGGNVIAGIKGRIDRADTASLGGARLVSVTDYKSSAKSLDVKLAEDGITIQPLLYTSVLCDNISDAVPAAMVYMPMTDPIVDESDFAKKGIENAVNAKMHPGGWIADDEEIIAAYSGGEKSEYGSFMPSGVGAKVDRTELKRRIDVVNAKIREAATGISAGRISAKPYKLSGKHDACEYCPYGGICRYE